MEQGVSHRVPGRPGCSSLAPPWCAQSSVGGLERALSERGLPSMEPRATLAQSRVKGPRRRSGRDGDRPVHAGLVVALGVAGVGERPAAVKGVGE